MFCLNKTSSSKRELLHIGNTLSIINEKKLFSIISKTNKTRINDKTFLKFPRTIDTLCLNDFKKPCFSVIDVNGKNEKYVCIINPGIIIKT